MCGIAGIIGNFASEERLLKMLKTQEHRGPDHTGMYSTENCAIGHNRLSIIDVSSHSNQPFYSKDGRYILSFNGEIYNYIELRNQLSSTYDFVTTSDTEVLLAAFIVWGESCLDRCNGMFSFAIWDTQDNTLFAARDRFGVKPFYYAMTNDSLVFASEIKTIFSAEIPRTSNTSVWANYFCFGSYGLPTETFWQDIHQLPAGHSLKFTKNILTIERWYDFEKRIKETKNTFTFEEAKLEYKRLLLDSIKLRFRADVPLGFNVSGGLDSSTLLKFVNDIDEGKDITAFTFYTNDSNYDELPWVESLLKLTSNPLEKVLLDLKDVSELAQKLVYNQDEPYGGIPTIAYSQIFKTAQEKGIKVLLDGQGVDEQLAGYDYYTSKNNSVIQGTRISPFKPHVLSKGFLQQAEKPNYPKPFDNSVQNLQYRDLFYTKLPRALRFNDRISMAASTELREPFLDYRLVEFAFSLPENYKIKGASQKHLLRQIMKEYLPEDINFAPKRPLQTPQREWLANELSSWMQASICQLQSNDWFDYDELEKEVSLYLNGQQDSSFHLWQWINCSLLLKIK